MSTLVLFFGLEYWPVVSRHQASWAWRESDPSEENIVPRMTVQWLLL